jgi:hypothetical protein
MVLAVVMRGMMEASTTRRFATQLFCGKPNLAAFSAVAFGNEPEHAVTPCGKPAGTGATARQIRATRPVSTPFASYRPRTEH